MVERTVEPLSDAELAGMLERAERNAPQHIIRAFRELQALRAAAWDVLTTEPDWGESLLRLRALLPAARGEED